MGCNRHVTTVTVTWLLHGCYTRQAAFEWAGAREKEGDRFPSHLLSPAVNPGSHSNVVLSLTLPDASTYTFGRDVNLLWKHGILAGVPCDHHVATMSPMM